MNAGVLADPHLRLACRDPRPLRQLVGDDPPSHGNELWEFAEDGLMRRREAGIDDVAIAESDRRIHGPRPECGLLLPIR